MRAFLILGLALGATAREKQRESGFVGYGIAAYYPHCAFACRDQIAGAQLNCSEVHHHHHNGKDIAMVMTGSECYASDDLYLQTMALCVKTYCNDISAWELERYWQKRVVGSYAEQPGPKYTYQEALNNINGTPTTVFDEETPLKTTSILPEVLWFASYNTMRVFIGQETQSAKFGSVFALDFDLHSNNILRLVILLSGVLIPIGFSLLRFSPFPCSIRSRFNAWVVDPPLFGDRHDRPILFGLAQMPKRGQAFFILYFIAINVILTSVNYEDATPNAWYPNQTWRWISFLVYNRMGVLSFANLPLVFLYAGRNNILLWITDWSHSTFLLIHRWIAAIATLQAILHSIGYLYLYVKSGKHNAEATKAYWFWGIVGTLALAILLPSSLLPIRKNIYEIFLVWHIALSILVIVGCYYHVVFAFGHSWGYETWILICMGVWAFDRIARFLRVLRSGIRNAEVTVIDDEYVRLTVKGFTTSGHTYLYFPTLTWRFWENHPFSVASNIIASAGQNIGQESVLNIDLEKQPRSGHQSSDGINEVDSRASDELTPSLKRLEPGSIFYIRKETGLTSGLGNRASISVLMEAGYHSSTPPLGRSLRSSPVLIAIAGGVGVTAVLPHLHSHPGRVKLYWGCRSQALVDDVSRTCSLGDLDKDIVVGKRLTVGDILENEVNAELYTDISVLVCGPASMVDEVRNWVNHFGRRQSKVHIHLEVESFSW